MYPKLTILPRSHDELEELRAWFWDRVDPSPSSGCWEWRAAIEGMGYGYATIGREGHKAHRLAWELSRGPIPDGLRVLHRCDNRRCVRPNHLFVGTLGDNMQDMWRKGRAGRRRYPGPVPPARRGEAAPFSKLREADVLTIRALMASGEHTQRAVARQFGVTPGCITWIVKRKSWTHI